MNTTPVVDMDNGYDVSRRRFFQLAGGIAGAGILLSACHKTTRTSDVYIGSGDTALLNLLYILQQLEAAFYTQACATPYYQATLDATELALLKDVRDQEVGHREFIKKLLATDAIADISPDFSAVTFADRGSVLKYAAILEDMTISAMSGVVTRFANKDYITPVAKMITVEARHSGYFKDLNTLNTFADGAVDGDGLGQSDTPANILAAAQAFIHTRFDATKLPS